MSAAAHGKTGLRAGSDTRYKFQQLRPAFGNIIHEQFDAIDAQQHEQRILPPLEVGFTVFRLNGTGTPSNCAGNPPCAPLHAAPIARVAGGARGVGMTLWVRFEGGFGTLSEGKITPHAGDMFGACAPSGAPVALAEVALLPPCTPGKFICLWNNFHALAAKLGQPIPQSPLYLLKPASAILAPGGIIRPPASYGGKVTYEGELGIVIGCTCRGAGEAEAAAAIFGYTCVNDVTALDLLTEDPSFPQWTRAKGCDNFGPFGPAIATGLDPSTLTVRTLLNGRERQNYPVSDMILPAARIVSLLSREMTLLPGDLIACGTSIGVLPMRPGAEVSVSIEGIGTLTNRVEAALS